VPKSRDTLPLYFLRLATRTPIAKRQRVYDISVEGAESFVASGCVVHSNTSRSLVLSHVHIHSLTLSSVSPSFAACVCQIVCVARTVKCRKTSTESAGSVQVVRTCAHALHVRGGDRPVMRGRSRRRAAHRQAGCWVAQTMHST
jgi:hypothetical protein